MMFSQVQAINGPAPNSWEDYNEMARLTYHGGHQDAKELNAFHHGISTMCRLFSEELPTIARIRELETELADSRFAEQAALAACQRAMEERDHLRAAGKQLLMVTLPPHDVSGMAMYDEAMEVIRGS